MTTPLPSAALEAGLYVDGRWREPSGTAHAVVNPATEEEIASVPSATADDVDSALAAARSAQREWGRLPAGIRGKVVRGGVLRYTQLRSVYHYYGS